MGGQLVAPRQVEPDEHHDLVTPSQVLGTLRDVLIEADLRPRRAFALVRGIVEDPYGRLHPPDRHEAIACLHKNSLINRCGHGARTSQIDSSALRDALLVSMRAHDGTPDLLGWLPRVRSRGGQRVLLRHTTGPASGGDPYFESANRRDRELVWRLESVA